MIDLDLVNKMKIPLKHIKVTRMSVLGQSVRSVGFISQTVQCVRRGKVTGTIHLHARVIRDLYTLFDVDCVASSRTYTKLMGRKPPDPPDNDDEGIDELEHLGDLEDVPDDIMEHAVKEKETDHEPRTNDDKGNPINNLEKDDIDDKWWGEGDLLKIVEKDAEYLANKKPWWNTQICSYPSDDYDDAVTTSPQFGTANHAAHAPSIKTKPDVKPKKDDNDTFCKLCNVTDQPATVYRSHHTFDPKCPSMTEQERKQLYGSHGARRKQGIRR